MKKEKNTATAQTGANFTGFSDWVEIFSGGKQTASSGKEYDGDDLIDAAVRTYDPKNHEAPAVLGHPAHDTPAYGWVESLKAETVDGVKRLMAKFRQVVPEFEEMVKSGRYKKRSASFYPDGRLRHVGWLGAMPPAVKGLADVAFSEEGAAIFDLIDKTQEVPMKFSEFMEVFKFWKKVQDDPEVEFTEPPGSTAKAGTSFTEADIEAAKAESAKKAREAAEAEFSERERARAKADTRKRIGALVEDGVKAGRIAPAWRDAGIAEFMAGLDDETAVSFAEGGEKKTGLAWFTGFLDGLPKLVNFSEVAKRADDVKAGAAGEKLAAIVKAKMSADKTMAYGAAFSEAQIENPDLAREYSAELAG